MSSYKHFAYAPPLPMQHGMQCCIGNCAWEALDASKCHTDRQHRTLLTCTRVYSLTRVSSGGGFVSQGRCPKGEGHAEDRTWTAFNLGRAVPARLWRQRCERRARDRRTTACRER